MCIWSANWIQYYFCAIQCETGLQLWIQLFVQFAILLQNSQTKHVKGIDLKEEKNRSCETRCTVSNIKTTTICSLAESRALKQSSGSGLLLLLPHNNIFMLRNQKGLRFTYYIFTISKLTLLWTIVLHYLLFFLTKYLNMIAKIYYGLSSLERRVGIRYAIANLRLYSAFLLICYFA